MARRAGHHVSQGRVLRGRCPTCPGCLKRGSRARKRLSQRQKVLGWGVRAAAPPKTLSYIHGGEGAAAAAAAGQPPPAAPHPPRGRAGPGRAGPHTKAARAGLPRGGSAPCTALTAPHPPRAAPGPRPVHVAPAAGAAAAPHYAHLTLPDRHVRLHEPAHPSGHHLSGRSQRRGRDFHEGTGRGAKGRGRGGAGPARGNRALCPPPAAPRPGPRKPRGQVHAGHFRGASLRHQGKAPSSVRRSAPFPSPTPPPRPPRPAPRPAPGPGRPRWCPAAAALTSTWPPCWRRGTRAARHCG